MDALTRSGLLLFVLLGAHTLDHAINQPARSVPALGGVVAFVGFCLVAAAVVLASRRSSYAPPLAVIAGAGAIAGFAVVHLLPGVTPLSDPYWDFNPNLISWLLLIAPIAAAGALTAAGLERLGRRPITA